MSATSSFKFIFKGRSHMVPESFVTKEHPGGKAILMALVGHDITEAFEDADHSKDALEMLEEWCVDVSPADKVDLLRRAEIRRAEEDEWRWRSTAIAFSVAAVIAAYVLRKSS